MESGCTNQAQGASRYRAGPNHQFDGQLKPKVQKPLGTFLETVKLTNKAKCSTLMTNRDKRNVISEPVKPN